MKNKKIYLLALFLLVCILSISSISATENTTNKDVISADNNQENNLETNIQYDDVSTSKENFERDLKENDNEGQGKSRIDKTTTANEDPLTFTDLNNTINGNNNSTIYLSNNYKYNNDIDDDFISGIPIDRELTVYGNGVTLDGSEMARIFKLSDLNLNVKFYNINFINGKAINTLENGSTLEDGGAIYGGNAYNCTFTNNKANQTAGAIYGGNAYNCIFEKNRAEETAGAIYKGNAYNCTFTLNYAYTCGVIYQGNAYNCTFTHNECTFNGGVIYQGNAYNCTFTENQAHFGGGAICEGNAYNCTFTGNTAEDGGAIKVGNATNCIFTYNWANYGGAIFKVNAYNCTFTGNEAMWKGNATYGGKAILCIFNGDTTYETNIIRTTINVLNYTSTYKSQEKLKFNLTADNMLFDGFNTTIKIYKGEELFTTVYGLTGEGWIVDLDPGEYTAVLRLTDYPEEPASNATITVLKRNTIVNITPITNVNIGEEVTINYTTNSNETAKIKVNGQEISDNKFTPTKEGTYNITIEIAENDYYTAGYNETSFIVEKTNTTIEIKPIPNVIIGEEVTINYTTNSNGTVTILVNGTPINDIKFTPTKEGTYNITIEIAENDYYTAATNSTTFTAEKLVSKITAKTVTTTYNVAKNLIITLKDSNGKAIKKAEVTVNLGRSKTYTTDNNGQIKINVATLTPKTYNTKIKYAGSDIYKASTASVKVTVKKATPKITAKSAIFKLKTKTKKYLAIIKDNKNKALKNTKVSLKIHGKTYTTKTNRKGQAVFKISNLKKKGTYTALITIPANHYYNKVNKKVKIIVKQ